MMLIITSPDSKECVDWLVENANKNFCFKQLLELGQLICSAGISDVYKPIKQGKELQEWIKDNRLWVYRFISYLWIRVVANVNLKPKTMLDLYKIRNDLFDSIKKKKRITYPKTAIWRYSKEYESEYPTNSELDIEIVTQLYKDYIGWKFRKSEVNNV